MKTLHTSSQFRKDFKLAEKRGKDMRKLQAILDLLATDTALPSRCRPHKLSGDYAGYWECHIEPDWLLIYHIGLQIIELARTGTHSDMFD
ncbi:MAG: type II toxin-antitoxin system YafQ family toxin [Proteobacteria bacterium]|nr:type II toxin-antitoxin system YafQ family toxin [Pseudomonadota bacterium]